jgi:hypothetical protein
MKRLVLISAGLALAGALHGGATAAERSLYDAKPDCMRRDAKAADCVVDDGPPRRRNAGDPPPAPPQPGGPAPAPAPQPSQIRR